MNTSPYFCEKNEEISYRKEWYHKLVTLSSLLLNLGASHSSSGAPVSFFSVAPCSWAVIAFPKMYTDVYCVPEMYTDSVCRTVTVSTWAPLEGKQAGPGLGTRASSY